MESPDPQEREGTQVYLAKVYQGHLECLVAKVTKVLLASLAPRVILVFLVSKETRDFKAHLGPRVSQERGGSQVPLWRALREIGEKQDNLEKQEPLERQDLLVCQAETANRETKETRVTRVSRERPDKRGSTEVLGSLDNLAFQVSMDRRESWACRVCPASQVQRVISGTLDSKENLETEDSQEKRVLMVPLVPLAPASSSKETLGSQEFKAYRDPRANKGSSGRKDSKV